MIYTSKIKRIYWLDIARVFAIISISMNHAVNHTFDNYNNTLYEFNKLPYILTCIKSGVSVFSRLGVPIFLMISGALLLNKKFNDNKDIFKFYKHNLLGIIITAEIWYFIIYWGLCIVNNGMHIFTGKIFFKYLFQCIHTMLFFNQYTFESLWYIPMIICIYLVIPYVANAVQKYSYKFLIVPVAIAIISGMIIPNINFWLQSMNSNIQLVFSLNISNLFSLYMIYVVFGFLISRNMLTRLSNSILIILIAMSFAFSVVFQFYAYSVPGNYLVEYNFFPIFICAVMVFELIKRIGEKNCVPKKWIIYISKISFAIYFLHRCIMLVLNKAFEVMSIGYIFKLIMLEVFSMLASIVIIYIFSKNKFIKKYLFMIKN